MRSSAPGLAVAFVALGGITYAAFSVTPKPLEPEFSARAARDLRLPQGFVGHLDCKVVSVERGVIHLANCKATPSP